MTRKILYGVQGTGQGHISRARGVAHALKDYDVDVTWLFSGRDKDKLFDMEPFGDFKHREAVKLSQERLLPGEFNTTMPWAEYSGMTEEDLGAIYDYLTGLTPIHNPVQKFTAAP